MTIATAARDRDPLTLAAAPTFALMALVAGQGMPAMCAAPGPLPIGGMTAMYLLMALFHLPPWLRLASRSRGAR
jgi:hypothetical protein